MQDTSQTIESRAIRSVFWKLFEQGGAAFIMLLVQVVMARLLGPREFGMLAIMLVFINLGNVIVQSGLNTSLIQSKTIDDTDLSTVFWLSFIISLLLYAIVFICAPAIASFYKLAELTLALRILGLIFLINSYNSIQEAVVAHKLNFKMTFYATVCAAVFSGASGILSALLGIGIWSLIIQQLLYQLIKSVVLSIQIKWIPRKDFDINRAKIHYSFGWKLLCAGILDQGYQSLSDLLIGKVFNPADLGVVSQGKKYPQAIGVLLDGAIQPVVLSATARIQSDVAYVKALARRALKTSTFLIVPAMILFAVLAKPLVALLLGDQWLVSVPYLQMYCIVYALLPIHTTNLQIINGVGRSDIFLKLELIKKAVGIAILLFCTFVFKNLTAIVFGYIVSGVICTFINAHPNKRVINYSYFEQLRDIAPAFMVALCAALITLPLELVVSSNIVLILLQMICFAVVYLLISYVFKLDSLRYIFSKLKGLLS